VATASHKHEALSCFMVHVGHVFFFVVLAKEEPESKIITHWHIEAPEGA